MFDCSVFSEALKNLNKVSDSEQEILTALNSNVVCGNHNHTFVYLKTSPKIAFQRISRRHQSADQYLTETYLENLSECYDKFYANLNPYQKICFQTEEDDPDELCAKITQFINQLFVPYYPYTYAAPFF